MGQAEIIIDMGQCQLLPHAVLALAERADPPSHRRHMLADGQVEALHERGVDLPAAGRQHLLDRLKRATHDPVSHVDQAPAPHGLDHLGVEQAGPRHPARLGGRPCSLTARELDPLPRVRQQGRRIRLEAIGQKQRHTVGRQHLHDLMHHALRHGQRAVADVDRQQQFRHGVDGRPDPVRRA